MTGRAASKQLPQTYRVTQKRSICEITIGSADAVCCLMFTISDLLASMPVEEF